MSKPRKRVMNLRRRLRESPSQISGTTFGDWAKVKARERG
jgi:hypothetical protein